MKIFSSATSLFVSHFHTLYYATLSLSLFHRMTLTLMQVFSNSHTRFLSQDVLAALHVSCLLADDPLSLSLSQSFHVSLTAPRRLSRLLRQQQRWPGFSGSPISHPVWGRAGSFEEHLTSELCDTESARLAGWGTLWAQCLWAHFFFFFYCCNGESKGSWVVTSARWTSQTRPFLQSAVSSSDCVRIAAFFYSAQVLLLAFWI